MTFTKDSTVRDVMDHPAFSGFGRLLFPADLRIRPSSTIEEISTPATFLWYSHIRPDKSVQILNFLAQEKKQIFYPLGKDAGLFFFRGKPGAPFAICCAGGGFVYCAALHDAMPHAMELANRGINAFVLIYRPQYAYEDLAKAIQFIENNAVKLQVDPDGYSIWGGSAGARMAAVLGNRKTAAQNQLPAPAAIIMQYTGYANTDPYDAPVYACVGDRDGIANWQTMKRRLQTLNRYGIPTEFHVFPGLGHGFGLGEGTVAEGWIDAALDFWKRQRKQNEQKKLPF